MNKISDLWLHIISLCKNMFFPAGIFAVAILSFYGNNSFTRSTLLLLHLSFYICTLVSLLILFYFNRQQPAFYIAIILISYILTNMLKTKYGINLENSIAMHNLAVFLPIGLLFFSFLPEKTLFSRSNLILLLSLFCIVAVVENLSAAGINIDYKINATDNTVPGDMSLFLFFILISMAFIQAIRTGKMSDYTFLFSDLCLAVGIYYYASPEALTIFYAATALILLVSVICNIYNYIYKDDLTGLHSRKAYVIQSASFPLKYSIGIISIDDYARLSGKFGGYGRDRLIKMIANRLQETEPGENIYRYNPEEFIIIFKNETKKEAYKRMENLRRQIAAAAFILPRQKSPVKLTVSGCVSEKKRSDANSVEVLIRARKVLQKALSFNHNITSQA